MASRQSNRAKQQGFSAADGFVEDAAHDLLALQITASEVAQGQVRPARSDLTCSVAHL